MISKKLNHLLTAITLVLVGYLPAPMLADPLLMDGKDSLFQRVIVRDSTTKFDAPAGNSGAEVTPLTPLYVFAREEGWLQVGLRKESTDLFWLSADATTPWNQNIVATIEASENTGRLLFFSEPDPIYNLLELETPGILAEELRSEAEVAEAGEGISETVVALGPRQIIDQRDNLYVMPIIDYEEEVFDNGAFVTLLKVAVARAQPAGLATPQSTPIPQRNATPEDYRLGVVFVVDTTVSMDPYIKATREALREVYSTVDEAGLSDAVSFGLVGYRDNIKAAPGLGYATQTFVTLQQGLRAEAFLEGIDQMTEADSSSRNFREDSYAGVASALTEMDWSQFDGRFIVLVTDAGPRDSDDEFSQTGMSGVGMNQVVRERIGAAIAVMHLKSPKGTNDHESAEAAYRDLARFPNQPPFYYSIENGDPQIFRDHARDLGNMLAKDAGRFRQNPDEVLREDGSQRIREEGDEPAATAQQNLQFAGLLSAGRTMQLAFLGRSEGASAPDVFEAYVADRDFNRTGLKPLSIRVLITKAQLSALFDAMNIIIEKGEENIIDPDQFFDQVLGAAADMSRNPDEVSRQAETSLAQAVSIDEYIEDLPYRSRIMNITQDDWLDMSFSEQAALLNDLQDKIARYREYNEATDLWVDYLGTGAQAQNLLYPLPLDDLP